MCEAVLETSGLIRVTHEKTIDHERDGFPVLRRSGHSQHFEHRRPHPYQNGETGPPPFDNQVLAHLCCSRGTSTRNHQHLEQKAARLVGSWYSDLVAFRLLSVYGESSPSSASGREERYPGVKAVESSLIVVSRAWSVLASGRNGRSGTSTPLSSL